ncbi:hypothetical protein BHM03_00017969 [Ensete ventricosum]|nr:hypothetical protein BHM03_00017969 [Ensete ventricosum]
MKALLQQYGDHNDDRAHSRDSPRRGLVELSRVAATSTSRHPETKPQTSPTANFSSNPRSKWGQQNPTSRLSIASCTEKSELSEGERSREDSRGQRFELPFLSPSGFWGAAPPLVGPGLVKWSWGLHRKQHPRAEMASQLSPHSSAAGWRGPALGKGSGPPVGCQAGYSSFC